MKQGLGNMNNVMSNSEVNANQATDNTRSNVNVAKPIAPIVPLKKPAKLTAAKTVQPARLTKPAAPMKIQTPMKKSKKK